MHILVMMSFLIIFNQPGPLPDFNKASLVSCIMQNTLLFIMILVVLILGLRPSSWKLEVENKGSGMCIYPNQTRIADFRLRCGETFGTGGGGP